MAGHLRTYTETLLPAPDYSMRYTAPLTERPDMQDPNSSRGNARADGSGSRCRHIL